MKDVWITSDLHYNHSNIPLFAPHRVNDFGMKSPLDMEAHNEYILNMINSKVKKNDVIYFLGDIVFGGRQDAIKFLSQIKCHNKYFINGNHDKSFNGLDNYFTWKGDMKQVTFKKNEYDFLDSDFETFMCHYPMKTWPRKPKGSMQLYGHVHDNSPFIDYTDDLCLNVGIDNPVCNNSMFNLRDVYEIYKKKLNGLTPSEYIEKISNDNRFFIR